MRDCKSWLCRLRKVKTSSKPLTKTSASSSRSRDFFDENTKKTSRLGCVAFGTPCILCRIWCYRQRTWPDWLDPARNLHFDLQTLTPKNVLCYLQPVSLTCMDVSSQQRHVNCHMSLVCLRRFRFQKTLVGELGDPDSFGFGEGSGEVGPVLPESS